MPNHDSKQFNTILNAIPDVMVLVDSGLNITAVNVAWGTMARDSRSLEELMRPVGMNYFKACAGIGLGDRLFASNAEPGLRELFAGVRDTFEMEYPCQVSSETRWYLLRVSAIPAEVGRAALCAHVDITRRKVAEMELARETRKLREESLTDPLTGLRNRRALEMIGQQYWENARRRGGVLAVIYVDLDDFKPINDNFGHDEGDRVLCMIADYLRHTFRGSDVVARVGGDEFVVLAWIANMDDLKHIQNRLRTKHHATTAGGDEYSVHMSVGYAAHDPRQEGDLLSLIKHADTQMYKSKRNRDR